MTKYSITWHFETSEELLAFLERNKDLAANGDVKKAAAGRPKKVKEPEADDLGDDDDLSGDDDDLSGADEEVVTLDTIKQMISTKSLDPEKKKKMKALLTKFGVEAASKLPSAKYASFYEKLKTI
jgi:hypothetical protein